MDNKHKVSLQITILGTAQTYEIDKSEFVLGRSDSSEAPVNEYGVSREHVKVYVDETGVSIEDLKSSNGTFINEQRIAPRQVVKDIKNSDIIRLGNGDVVIQIVHLYMPTISEPSIQSDYTSEVAPAEYTASPGTSAAAVSGPEILPDDLPLIPASSEPVDSNSPPQPVSSIEADHKENLNLNQPDPAKLHMHVPGAENPPIVIDLSAFPKGEEDFRVSFKKVGIKLPTTKTPQQQSQEVLKEAEYMKQAILKSAEVFKIKTMAEAKVQSKKAADQAYSEYQKMVDILLDETRQKLLHLKTETEILLEEKRLQASEEIQNLWKEHEEQVRLDKERQYDIIEKENKIKLDLSLEKLKSDMFSERHRIITEAENDILQKKRAYLNEFENEKGEHIKRIKNFTEELKKVQQDIQECEDVYKKSRTQKEYAELELSKVLSQLKLEKEHLEHIVQNFQETMEKHKLIETEVAQFAQLKMTSDRDQAEAKRIFEELKAAHSSLAEKRQQLDDDVKKMSEHLEDSKKKAKSDLEAHYKNLRDIEAKKFEDYQANQVKEFQAIRDAHAQSIKKFSVDLSQEIASKLEMQSKKVGNSNFDFEKNLELINSVIQVKSAMDTGSESKHAQQLENWKNRKRKENMSLMTSGFVAGLVCLLAVNFAYKKLNTDPVEQEMARLREERQQKHVENTFIPTKVAQYYDTYVDATLYTENFPETYLNDSVQQEWVNYATKYFLRQWKVEEEKVIQVISNSRAFVQTVEDAKPTLKKDRIKSDLAKLKALEDENIQNQATILGTNVKYEAYKKLEKEFFTGKMQNRQPAGR